MCLNLTSNVRKRVEAWKDLQGQHDKLKTKAFEQGAVLEAKYQKLYEPLYTKVRTYLKISSPLHGQVEILLVLMLALSSEMQRYEIVNGVVEVEGVTNETTKEEGEEKAPEGAQLSSLCIVCYLFSLPA